MFLLLFLAVLLVRFRVHGHSALAVVETNCNLAAASRERYSGRNGKGNFQSFMMLGGGLAVHGCVSLAAVQTTQL